MTQPMPAPPDPNTSSTEPLLSVGTIVAVVTALVDLAVVIGWHPAPATRDTILTITTILAPTVVALWGRRKVFSPATVATLLSTRR